MKILVIWENSEFTNIFSIDENDHKKIEMIRNASGQFVNYTDNDENAILLDDYLDKNNIEEIFPEDATSINLKEYDFFVHSGFIG